VSKRDKIREKEGSVSVNTPSVEMREDAPDFLSYVKKGLFGGFAILTFGLPVLLIKTYRDFMHIEEESKEEG